MEAKTLFLRTVLIYVVIYAVFRLMGKREIGKLSVFDLVISIMITEMAVIAIENLKEPLWRGILPIAVLVGLQVGTAFFSLKSRTLREWFDGKPSLLIKNGKLDREEMKRQRYSLDDLLMQLREAKVINVSDVEFAILEPTGRLSVTTRDEFQKDGGSQQPNQKSPIRYAGLPIPVIMDGKVQDKNLEMIGQTRFWLKNELQAHGVQDVKEVFLCTVNHKGELCVHKK